MEQILMEKLGDYSFELLKETIPGGNKQWFYTIKNFKNNLSWESQGYFSSEQQARFAAVGHITLLENEKCLKTV